MTSRPRFIARRRERITPRCSLLIDWLGEEKTKRPLNKSNETDICPAGLQPFFRPRLHMLDKNDIFDQFRFTELRQPAVDAVFYNKSVVTLNESSFPLYWSQLFWLFASHLIFRQFLSLGGWIWLVSVHSDIFFAGLSLFSIYDAIQ